MICMYCRKELTEHQTKTFGLCCGDKVCKTQIAKAVSDFLAGSGDPRVVSLVRKNLLHLIQEKLTVQLPAEFEPIKEERRGPILSISLEEKYEGKSSLLTVKIHSGKYCLYCGTQLGSIVRYKKKVRTLTLNMDHFRPIMRRKGTNTPDYLGPNTIVLSCQICNSIKGKMLFNSFIDAKNYILDQLLHSDWKLLE